jgi:hypothetical protein
VIVDRPYDDAAGDFGRLWDFLVQDYADRNADYSWSVGHWTLNPLTQEWEPDQGQGNPVLDPEPGQWDGWGILTVTVLHDGAMFHLWYAAMASYHGSIQVGYASSPDGSVWTKHPDPLPGLGPGDPGGWDDHGTAPHSVLSNGGSYSMWYTAFSGGPWGTWRIGYASSTNGIDWDKNPDPVLEGSEPWEGANLYFPAVVPYGSGLAMWYSGANIGQAAAIGYAVSSDGLLWGRWPDNPVLSPTPPCNAVDSSAVILEGGTAHGWVSHCLDIYHVSSPLEVVFFDGFETGDTTIWSAVVP